MSTNNTPNIPNAFNTINPISIINNKYNIEKIISSGSFGNVYKCIYNNKYYAIKEDINYKTLKHEATIYKELRSVKNVSMLYDFFNFNSKYYMVLDLYEYTLINFKYRYKDAKNYIDSILLLMRTLIITIEHIHHLGIIHRDIKPNNICMDNNFNPHIIDFGLSKKIIQNNIHLTEKKTHNIIGSYNFISINVFNMTEPSRRDDIESLMYIFIYMLLTDQGYVEYDQLNISCKKKINYIQAILSRNNVINSVEDIKIINNLITSLQYIRKLNFSQKPNYAYLSSLLD